MTESERKAAFKACPILSDYLATALEDLQFSEADAACMDGRQEEDSGSIYDCPNETFQRALQDCREFMSANAEHVEAATDCHPANAPDGPCLTVERIGSTFYLQRVGHGVGFTDDGDAPCLEAMGEYCRSHHTEGLYFGDDGKVYWA